MAKLTAPYYPIIYVRGYAMTQDAIVETTSTPFMGFEAGSTKMRQARDGSIRKFVFESPLVRLMKDYAYRDIYTAGSERTDALDPRCVVVHRYYDPADPAFGDGSVPSILDAAKQLGKRIEEIRALICTPASGIDPKDFKVYLVAHSMGGLICRCLLQNPNATSAATRATVDKLFTYATPHNGIEMGGINVPGFLTFNDMKNFSRKTMADYLAIPGGDEKAANTLGDSGFPPERVFCLVGTNSRDYAVAHGLSSFAVGAMSDGLVRIQNAYVEGSPRAFVNRSHSGYFGIVNSEEGYQNLVRFLFGNVKATGTLEIIEIPFPPDVEKARKAGNKIDSAYYIETTVAPRGAYTYDLSCRTQDNGSAVRREYEELFKPDGTRMMRARARRCCSRCSSTRARSSSASRSSRSRSISRSRRRGTRSTTRWSSRPTFPASTCSATRWCCTRRRTRTGPGRCATCGPTTRGRAARRPRPRSRTPMGIASPR